LGFGLTAFAGARIESGFDLFARYARLEKRIRAADVVITGEGAMDEQTRMGKGVGQIARWCAARGVPCIGLAGVVEQSVRESKLFAHTRALTEMAALPRAKKPGGALSGTIVGRNGPRLACNQSLLTGRFQCSVAG
jgi:glycerate kinase